ncbi:MAG: DUF971 domain-containing protein [Rhodoblastus sp.]|nr:MAG: DUF971 domain-containing protein [Rhodoblastus sp.]
MADRIAPEGRRTPVGRQLRRRRALRASAEYLRVASPSAEVQGHSPAERKTVPGKRDVLIISAEPIGNYAVKLGFDDLHDTGIYSWSYLRELGAERATRWAAYLDDLAAKGLSRDRARP